MEGKELIKKRFAHNLKGYDALSVVQRSICERIDELLGSYIPSLDKGTAMELGAGTGFLTNHLLRRFSSKNWVLNDIVPQTEAYLEKVIDENGYKGQITYAWGDAENISFPQDLSLLASASLFQWFDSLDLFLKRVGENIIKDGYVVFSSFGKDNFFEIKVSSLGRKGVCFPSYSQVHDWCVDAGFEVLYSEQYIQEMVFPSVSDMLHYLRDTGVNGNVKGSWNRAEYKQFCDRYKTIFADEDDNSGSVKLSFNPTIFILKKI